MDDDIVVNMTGMLQWERIKQLLPADLFEELEYAIISILTGEERALREADKLRAQLNGR